MSVFRIEKNKNYTVMSNYHLREKDMSLKAKGLLSLMLSLPENWDYSIDGLVAICKENETSIKSTLNELKEFGYLEVNKIFPDKSKSGRIEYEYIIYEQKQDIVKQALENLPLEVQGVENQGQLNKEYTITKNENTNNNIICPETEIINYLNEKAGTHFRDVESNLKFIRARLKDYSEADLKAVVDKKVKEWKGTTMQPYLRPETLFNATKFESYVNGLDKGKQDINKPKNTAIIHQREYTKEELQNVYSNIDDWL